MEGMERVAKKPIKITDTTFRDGHQSSLATRMRTEDMEPIAEELDRVGYILLNQSGGTDGVGLTFFLDIFDQGLKNFVFDQAHRVKPNHGI